MQKASFPMTRLIRKQHRYTSAAFGQCDDEQLRYLFIFDVNCLFVTRYSNFYVALFQTFGMQKDDNILLEVFQSKVICKCNTFGILNSTEHEIYPAHKC